MPEKLSPLVSIGAGGGGARSEKTQPLLLASRAGFLPGRGSPSPSLPCSAFQSHLLSKCSCRPHIGSAFILPERRAIVLIQSRPGSGGQESLPITLTSHVEQ